MHTEWPQASDIPAAIKKPDTTPVQVETGKSYIEKFMQGIKDQLSALKWDLKMNAHPSTSSTPGGNVGERPDIGAGSGTQGSVWERPFDAVGIPTPPVQHLDVGTIPHTTTPTNTPYDPFLQ